MCAFTSSLAPWMRFGRWFRRHPALGRCRPGRACPSGPTKHAGRVAGTLRSRPRGSGEKGTRGSGFRVLSGPASGVEEATESQGPRQWDPGMLSLGS